MGLLPILSERESCAFSIWALLREMTFSGTLQQAWLIFLSVLSRWMERSHQIQLQLFFKFSDKRLEILVNWEKSRGGKMELRERDGIPLWRHQGGQYSEFFFLTLNHSKIYICSSPNNYWLLWMRCSLIFPVLFHSIKIAGRKPWKWRKNPIISDNAQFERLKMDMVE